MHVHSRAQPDGHGRGKRRFLDAAGGPWHGARMANDEGFASRTGRRGGEATAIGDLLRAAAAPAMRRMGFGKSELIARWGEIVGPALADHSRPVTVRYPPGRRAGGVLDVSADPAQAAELRAESPALIARINELFGYPAVAHINIRPRR